MTRLVRWLVAALVGLSVLTSAGPILAALAHALAPLVIALGCMALVLRLAWYFTHRY